jgi:hypothetical protein
MDGGTVLIIAYVLMMALILLRVIPPVGTGLLTFALVVCLLGIGGRAAGSRDVWGVLFSLGLAILIWMVDPYLFGPSFRTEVLGASPLTFLFWAVSLVAGVALGMSQRRNRGTDAKHA